jgi:hypothetical protein
MKLLYIFLFSLLTLSIYGQQTDNRFLVTGSVFDAETGTPLQFVTITLQDTTTKEIVGTITNKKGTFDFLVPQGKYNCIVESLSFKPFIINSIDVCQDYEVGVVELNQNIEELEEVEVVAKSKLMDYKFSKKVYHASKDISNVGGNAITVIENTPTVRISEEGKITIRGNSATVLVNGKPYGGQKTNADILSLIPANSIKNIEILTRSAKNDADGGGEILNILLKKGIVDGYNGTVEVHGGYPDNDGINTFLNYKSETVNLYTTASFNHNVELKNTNIHQTFLNSTQQAIGNFDETRDDYRQKNNVLFNIGSDFLINDKNTITASLLFTNANKNYDSEFVMNDYQPVDQLINSSLRDTKDHSDVSFFESFFNFTTKFNDKGHQLSLDMNFSKNRAENNTTILDEVVFPNVNTDKKAYKKDELVDTYYFQLDYNYTFKNKSKLTAGHKSNFRSYNNDFIANNFNLDSPLGTPIIGYENNVQYKENVYSFYMNFSQQHEKFSYSFGLRTEYTQTEINVDYENDQYNNNYNKFFPSATLAYTFENGNNLSTSFYRFIDRPSISELNPINSFVNQRFIRSGNPYLKPNYTNYIVVEFNQEFDKLFLNTAIYYSNSTDEIFDILEKTDKQTEDGFDIYHSYPINNGTLNYTGLELSVNYNPIKKIRFSGLISPYYSSFSDTFENRYDYDDFRWWGQVSFAYRMNNTLRFQVNYAYQSPSKTALTGVDKYQYTNFTASKDLFDNKATLTFKMSDVFHTRKANYTSTEANAITNREVLFKTRYLLTFTYRFNKASKRNANNRSKDINKDVFEIKEKLK